MSTLNINSNSVRKRLNDFIRNELARADYKHVVVGLSGGLDSTLACYLAAEALGAANVLAICMPYKTSSPESLEHAHLVIQETGVRGVTIPISEMIDPLFDKFPDMNSFRKGNIMARARMIVLFDQSAANNALVVGTGNKTEIILGYTTIYGDAACAFNPLGDLYKTQVRQLATEMKVPEVIIRKPPSADLWAGQTDEGELGFTYQEVDQLLYLLFNQQRTPVECEEEGFSKEFIDRVVTRIRKNAYKRKMPPVARITEGEMRIDI